MDMVDEGKEAPNEEAKTASWVAGSLLPADPYADTAIGPPPAKRQRTMPMPEDRILCQPVAFTNLPAKPRMYLLPLRKKVTAPPAASSSSSSSTSSSSSSSASSSSSSGAGAGASLLPPPEIPIVIPLVRPPVLQNLDDYLSLVGNMYYAAPETGKSNSGFALLRRTTLGRLTSPIREPSVLDRWSPYEIALFESGICLTGKLFAQLAKIVGTKSPKDCIEFYYFWKKSKNYQQWKVSFRSTAGDNGDNN